MKHILIILTTLLLVTALACTKTKQRILHNKDWKNIQGTWDIQQVLIDGVDSTSAIKGDCYAKMVIEYADGERTEDGTLHLFDALNNMDFGSLNIEQSKYKSIRICGFNLNIITYFVSTVCKYNLKGVCVNWSIIELTSTILKIKATFNGKEYNIKYIKT
jgi:hypothetical protein